jgi:transposase
MSQPFFVRRLSKSERKAIKKLRKRPPNVAVYQRAQTVYFSSQRLKVPQIARIVDRDRSVVSRWLHRFEERGVAGLWPDKSTGRPPKADADYQAALVESVSKNPRDLGYAFTRWTSALLAEHLRRVTHVQVCAATVSKTLRRLGYRHGQPKLDLKHRQDPKEVTRAKRQKRRALKKAEPVTVRLRLSTVTKRSSTSTPASAVVGRHVVSG